MLRGLHGDGITADRPKQGPPCLKKDKNNNKKFRRAPRAHTKYKFHLKFMTQPHEAIFDHFQAQQKFLNIDAFG